MKQDERGLALSTDSAAAVTSFDRAVEHYLKFHADTMVLADKALAADPDFVMGHCLKAYLLLMAANPANRAQIDATLARAQTGAANLTARERMHLAAATAWHQGTIERSFQIWGQILDADPTDLLAFRISDTIWFRHGQTQSILAQADRVTPRWSADLPGYDCAQTIWAFAHEEVGDTKGAEPRGRCGAGTRPDQLLRASRQGARAGHRLPRARGQRVARRSGGPLVAGQQPDPSPVVASHADAARPRRARCGAGELRREHPQLRRPDDQGDARPLRRSAECLRAAVAAGSAGPRCRQSLGRTGRQGGGAHRRGGPPADGAAPDDGARRHRARRRRGTLPRRVARTGRRSDAVDRAGDRRRGDPGLRGRRSRTVAASMRGSSSCWSRVRTRSACSAAATRSATCSSRC